jgi:hypothetical protein
MAYGVKKATQRWHRAESRGENWAPEGNENRIWRKEERAVRELQKRER